MSSIGSYVRDHLDGEDRRTSFVTNIKGIYHELSYQHAENNDGDEWFVELSAITNEPGIDAWLYNRQTGE